MVLGKATWLLVGAMVVAWMVLSGPSAPSGALDARSLPADPVRDVVANRVMTWNLCNPCETDNDDRAAEIARFAPQVIGLQEACVGDVEKIRDYLENLHGLVYHVEYGAVLQSWGRCGGAPWNPGGYGEAILSAAPMTDVVTEEYPDGGSEDRGYMEVTTTVGGRQVRLFNTHLAERRQEPVRAAQVGVLAKEVARHDRAIVIGDFNAVPDGYELTPMWKLAADADPQCRPGSDGTCEPTTDWQSKFDYVFLRDYVPVRHRVHPNEVSDHHVLYADVNPA
ncbi:endonuclease/exonuclease/phosphatase family metal-dependent hydrolase [Streptomyces sp. SAI-208]|uniref:endonuclease/exonuclease/phosphatase family protein n=1 Tax=unclassified Streptomyces TaxID=2593676 RepID=UPI0024751C8D|nr:MULTISPECIES: endonuclease/exonuclease/phosphatase family protein [unclassified Streptomyces]MDH6520754.1 endonuclease/exonuclease/phosphatase family metal-dependent hydrolase [Streptomyces sp. SAI-090]MDH6552974.1 endonuclease/exonuclease/phosphatase family metal-dependent hydrolase [Streptomyces sp. SAI-041]MDH6572058.1 endonuclease/exonuclease/phosphatase family metal-dependent hydrolase [Streptomyces sp. SAI-117]MDH6582982.1 endonuclease/exonuclease/phosphatase family metal-dependent hyd